MEHQYQYFMSETINLPEDAWLPFVHLGQLLSYPKNKILYSQGDYPNCFYYIVSGRVRTFISSTDGNERLLTIYRKGDILGEASFFDENPRVSSAQLMTDGQVVAIDRAALEQCMQANPSLAFFLLKYLAGTVRMLSTHLDAASFLSADKRIIRLLLNMDINNDHCIHITHEELGYSLGISRVTVSRILSSLAKRGWISLSYKKITLLNRDMLEHYICESM